MTRLLLLLPILLVGCVSQRPATYAGHAHLERWNAVLPVALRDDGAFPIVEERLQVGRLDVHLDRRHVPQPKEVSVVLVHGGGGHGRLLAPIGLMLARAGYESVAPDLPGYGLTTVPEGLPLTWSLWVDVVREVARRERARTGRRVVLCGLSIGGTLAWHAAAGNADVDGVMVTTLLDLRDPVVRARVATSPALSHLSDGLGKGGALDGWWLPLSWVAPLDLMTSDQAVLAQYRKDPFVAKAMPFGFWRSMGRTPPVVEPEATTTPLLVAHPGADAWTPTELSLPTFERFSGKKTLVRLSNGGHLPLEAPARDELAAAMVAFLEGLVP
ncbi:MAG: alpha/beta fold hydrolase [Myxococcaceae bacterium]|nr:alpha/beta fold hydrolase [Myxococcaceae bacterium]